MILGIGTDILEIRRITHLIEQSGTRFLDRWFSPEEITYCQSKKKPQLHFAARMSAKEAIAKAIRIEASQAVPWLSITIERDDSGAPRAVLTGQPLERARDLGVEHIHLSISHTEEYATATAVAEGTPKKINA